MRDDPECFTRTSNPVDPASNEAALQQCQRFMLDKSAEWVNREDFTVKVVHQSTFLKDPWEDSLFQEKKLQEKNYYIFYI